MYIMYILYTHKVHTHKLFWFLQKLDQYMGRLTDGPMKGWTHWEALIAVKQNLMMVGNGHSAIIYSNCFLCLNASLFSEFKNFSLLLEFKYFLESKHFFDFKHFFKFKHFLIQFFFIKSSCFNHKNVTKKMRWIRWWQW